MFTAHFFFVVFVYKSGIVLPARGPANAYPAPDYI